MTWPVDESKTRLIDALLTFKEINGDDKALHFLEQELTRELVIKHRRAGKQQALPKPEPADDANATRRLDVAADALDFYADSGNWAGRNSEAMRDKGKRARAALGEILDSESEGE
jgi:hypothetical protein